MAPLIMGSILFFFDWKNNAAFYVILLVKSDGTTDGEYDGSVNKGLKWQLNLGPK